jgi:hypothetical protein
MFSQVLYIGVIHRRKVEVDDQAQLEQSKIIEKLYTEKNKITEAYSDNLKILEEYLEIINSKDSEILDLRLVIQSYENDVEDLETSVEHGTAFTEQRPAAATVTDKTGATPLRPPQRLVNPSPPSVAPPAGMRAASAGTGRETSSATALANIRAASAAAVRRSASAASNSSNRGQLRYTSDDENDEPDDEHSPTQPVTISRSRVTKLTRHGSTNSPGTSAPLLPATLCCVRCF